MTGDCVNDTPPLKKAGTGIAVQGSNDATGCTADYITSPGLSAVIDDLKHPKQIFPQNFFICHLPYALSIHLVILRSLGLLFNIPN
ncbi:Plasma membrane [Nakaseomyces bracarensis]|uniref:Plasma membrane n=1 Tax=Nakaseomyces bracarensis TaxID=273131 RepID=A0ABR4NRY3_9SACH